MMDAIQNFVQDLARMQWSDYLDIIVVAVLIYKLLPLIRARHYAHRCRHGAS